MTFGECHVSTLPNCSLLCLTVSIHCTCSRVFLSEISTWNDQYTRRLPAMDILGGRSFHGKMQRN